jgi:hypothetical protein
VFRSALQSLPFGKSQAGEWRRAPKWLIKSHSDSTRASWKIPLMSAVSNVSHRQSHKGQQPLRANYWEQQQLRVVVTELMPWSTQAQDGAVQSFVWLARLAKVEQSNEVTAEDPRERQRPHLPAWARSPSPRSFEKRCLKTRASLSCCLRKTAAERTFNESHRAHRWLSLCTCALSSSTSTHMPARQAPWNKIKSSKRLTREKDALLH